MVKSTPRKMEGYSKISGLGEVGQIGREKLKKKKLIKRAAKAP